MSFKPTSKIFDKAARSQAVTNLVSRHARSYKRLTQERMIKGPHSGRTYAKKRGAGFRRAHRASARGQRPSPDTGTLVNAIQSKMTGQFTARVDVAERINPANGQKASDYASILQQRLGRPIMTERDAAEEQRKIRTAAEMAIKTLL